MLTCKFDEFVKDLISAEPENRTDQDSPIADVGLSAPATQFAFSMAMITGAVAYNPLSKAFAVIDLENFLSFLALAGDTNLLKI